MDMALKLADVSLTSDLPIAAVITNDSGLVIASSRNAVAEKDQVTAHAELLAIGQVDLKTFKRDAGSLTLTVTLEPCPMCAWAIRSAGIGRVIFGAYNSRYGAAGSVFDLLRDYRVGPKVQVIGGVLQESCQGLLDGAFMKIRNNGQR